MSQNLTNADAALKDDYLPAIREQLNNAHVLLTQVESGSVDVEGRNAVLSLHVQRNHGVGARAESGTLPSAGNQGWVEERTPLRYNYGRIQLTGPVINATKSDRGSYVRALKAETEGLVTDLKRDFNRQLFGLSNGVIAACGTTSASATVSLAATTSIVAMRQFEVGMIVDIVDVSASTTALTTITDGSARTITSVDAAAQEIVLSGAVVTTTSDEVVTRTGSYGGLGATIGGGQKELTGVQSIVDDSGTLFNVNSSTYEVWKSTVKDNSSTLRDISDTLLEELIEDIAISGGQTPNFLIGPHSVRRAYAASLKTEKRFNDTVDLKGGFKALTVSADNAELLFAVDRDAPYMADDATGGQVFALNTGCLFEHTNSGWDWMDKDGAVLSRVANADAYEATLYKYSEFTTDKRNAHGVLQDLNVS